jgi:hypothetical protein
MDNDERTLLKSIRRCFVCLESKKKLRSCEKCKMAWVCTGCDSGETVIPGHSEEECGVCVHTNQIDMLNFQELSSSMTRLPKFVHLPLSHVSEYKHAPDSWQEYEVWRNFPSRPSVEFDANTLFLTKTMTIMRSLNVSYSESELSKMQYLTIHLIGAYLTELQTQGAEYEELHHLMPDLKVLNMVVIGPEVPLLPDLEVPMCSACVKRGKKLRVTIRRQVYEDCYRSVPQPDLVFAFSPGFSALGSWNMAIGCALSMFVPLAWTSLHEFEFEMDWKFFESSFNFFKLVFRGENPFKLNHAKIERFGLKPRCAYHNQCLTVIKGDYEQVLAAEASR